MFSLCAIALYLLAPSLLAVFAEVPALADLNPWAAAFVLGFEIVSFMAAWWQVRVALPQASWFVASTSQLTSNAISRVIPGGAVTGGGVQFAMLNKAGIDAGAAGAALTATSLIMTGTLLALPVLALPAVLTGTEIPDTLASAALVGGGALIVILLIALALSVFDAPFRFLGDWIAAIRARLSGGPEDRTIGETLVAKRNEVRGELGSRWQAAIGSAAAKWIFDYLALLAAVKAVGSDAPMSLVLLAYTAAAVLTMIPVTPGGLGFVEAGLTATLVAAGVPTQEALLATLTYRLVSYWLPLPAGLVAYQLFRTRYGADPENPAEQGPPAVRAS
jgi:uncharacterized protein (TIRG00374 family)